MVTPSFVFIYCLHVKWHYAYKIWGNSGEGIFFARIPLSDGNQIQNGRRTRRDKKCSAQFTVSQSPEVMCHVDQAPCHWRYPVVAQNPVNKKNNTVSGVSWVSLFTTPFHGWYSVREWPRTYSCLHTWRNRTTCFWEGVVIKSKRHCTLDGEVAGWIPIRAVTGVAQ